MRKSFLTCALLIFVTAGCTLKRKEVMSPTPPPVVPIIITSSAFVVGGWVPIQYTCDGADMSPPLHFEHVPPQTKSLVVTLDDPDSPNGPFSHWILYNIPPNTHDIPEHFVGSTIPQGMNSAQTQNYFGPCPNLGTHRYIFTAYALNTLLPVNNKDKVALERDMQGHIIGMGQLLSRYARK